ncbi:MAG: hypothetical protein AAB501_02805 [Patescibacteria group bacterium]
MRRVYATWIWNRSKPILFLQLPLAAIFLAIQHEYVAFRAVASNALTSLNSPSSTVDYIVTAFQNAEPLVAFLGVAIALFTVLALNSITRNLIALSSSGQRSAIRLDK